MNQLIITEKPSVAKAIGDVLGAKNKKNGYLEGGGYIVSWCVGHLVELASPEVYDTGYAKWKKEDLPLIPNPWVYVISEATKKQYAVLKQLLLDDRTNTVICATDAGREGELIFRLVYNQVRCTKPVKRLWISSLEESAIREGIRTMKDGAAYDLLYQAALCRLHADWLVGINATRLYSLLYGQTLNIGRVMTPTLALVVSRDAAISSFQPEPFYTVQLSCGFLASSERLKDREEAERIAAECQCKAATVRRIERKRRTDKPPKLYDLTSLQRDANRIYGFTAQQTLDYVQSLYEKKLTTYPRTDSRYLTNDMASTLPALAHISASQFPFLSGLTLSANVVQVVNDAKVTDHHAIIPTQTVARCDPASLPQGERDILSLIVVRLLSALGDAHCYEETAVELNCEGHIFTAKGKTIIQMGWQIPEATFRGSLGARGAQNKEHEYPIPSLAEGQQLSPVLASVKEGKTSPPKHYTEDTLLAAMETAGAEDAPEDAERKGLGTPATRAGILEKLISAGFVERKGDKKTKHLLATPKGQALIAVVPELIQSPAMTAEWEHRLKDIEHGKADSASFMADICHLVCDLVQNGSRVRSTEKHFSSQYMQVGICPRCGAPVVDMPKGFFCENGCCRFGIWKDNKFFVMKGHAVTAEVVSILLSDGSVFLRGLRSTKSNRLYDATVYLDDHGEGTPQFRLSFAPKDAP